jgi:hypothetical protein
MEPSAAALPLPGGVEEPPQHDVQHDVPPAGAEQPAAEQPGHAASMAADGGRLPPLHGQRYALPPACMRADARGLLEDSRARGLLGCSLPLTRSCSLPACEQQLRWPRAT